MSVCYSYLIKLIEQCLDLANDHTSKDSKRRFEKQDTFDLTKLPVGKFIHPTIQANIKERIKLSVNHSFVWEGLRVSLYYGAQTIVWKRVKEIIILIKTFISCLAHLRQHSLNIPHLNCIIVDLNAPKRSPMSIHDPITSEHVNSGLFDPSSNTIIIYRKEEFVKVLIHELIHALSLDAKRIPDHDLKWFNTILDISCNPVLINETFTDAYACLLYTVYEYVCNKEKLNLTFHSAWMKQVGFIKSQACLVWNFYLRHKQANNSLTICEQTNVSAYYILKAMLLWKPKMFLEFLVKNKYSLCGLKTSQDDFVNLLKATTIENLPHLLECKDSHGIIGKSIRMSSIL